jgi:hypothetical protein
MFHVGQLVVCVDASHRILHRIPAKNFITEGSVYTVRWVGPPPYEGDRHIGLAIRLVGIERGADRDADDPWRDYPFAAFRFRPAKLASKEVFESLLAPFKPEKVRA